MQALAFVDLETTGASPTKDRITEIGIVLVDEQGVREWSQLIYPQMRIPLFIEQMTGISNAMVADAPTFAEIASSVASLLQGHLFIAHNARFDYGFLKNEFKRVGLSFKPSVLCTVKLSRTLFPNYRHHNLDSLIERYQLTAKERHRALADAQLIYQFWQYLQGSIAATILQDTVQQLLQRSSLPSQLDPMLVHELPEGPGVYLFYGRNDLPLYIGKSINIKQRVLAHFAADHRHSKEMSLSQQIQRIEWIETAGELGALLIESKLIKQLLPIYNQRLRRKNALCTWQLSQTVPSKPWQPLLTWANDLNLGSQEPHYGLFHTQRDAHKAMRSLAEQQQLCLGILGLDKISKGKPCFAYQLKKCQGACVGKEPINHHNLRLLTALTTLKLAIWPYAGAIGIQEGEDLHVLDHWCYLGTAKHADDIPALLSSARPTFDRDSYQLLSKVLKKSQVIALT